MRPGVRMAIAGALLGGCQLVFPIDALTAGSSDAGDAQTDDVVLTSPDCGSLNTTQNCGRCGHDCLGAACKQGTCEATPVGSGSVFDLAYDPVSDKLFFGDDAPDGGVYALDPNTSQTSPIATHQGGPVAIAVRNPYVVWGNENDGRIVRAVIDGGSPTVIATGAQNVNCIAINSTTIFWADRTDVRTASLYDGGIGPSLGAQGAVCVAASDTWVAVVSNQALVQFAWPNTSTTAASSAYVASNGHAHGVAVLALDAGAVYTVGGGSVRRNDIGVGGDPAPIATSNVELSYVMADPGGVFWLSNNGGVIQGCSDPTCATGMLTFAKHGFPNGLTTDGTYLYFGTADGVIYRAPR